MQVRRAQAGELRLDRNEALRYLGYAGHAVDDGLLARFEQLARACEDGLQPTCAHAWFGIDEARTCWDGSDVRVVLDGCGLTLAGRDIAEHARGAVAVALMACTLGVACERELRKYAALSPTDALLYGAAASALVEAAADAAEAVLVEQAAAQGLRTSFRYSPGYGDFPLAVQPAFLAALDAPRRMGLSATDANLLVPTKSVTAVVAAFDADSNHSGVRMSCARCSLRASCTLRKKGTTCHG